jgi:tRNA(Arg) A34 adenosine deaminase TadA
VAGPKQGPGQNPPRRALLRGVGAITVAACGLSAARGDRGASAQSTTPGGLPPASGPLDRPALIARATALRRLAEERGDQPYGAVVARDGRVVGEAPSRVVALGDPTAHAEMEAIRDACRRFGTRSLTGCLLYASSPPCRMCEAAAYWASVSGIVHGPTGIDAGAPRYGAC